MQLRHIPHNEIDKMKWDACIKSSFNGLIWGFSWYLDIVCDKWDAIVEGDYQRVMPLPVVYKYKQPQIKIPPYVKQLGVFSIDKLNSKIVDSFAGAIPQKFKYVSLPLNDMNKTESKQFKHSFVRNFQLDLVQPYDTLVNTFNDITKSKLIEAYKNELTVTRNISTEVFISFYKNAKIKTGLKLTKANEVVLTPLINTLTRFNLAEIHGVYDKNERLCGVAFFLIYLNRLSIMKIATDDYGSSLAAEYLIINEFIKSNSNKNVTLDFPQNVRDKWLEFNTGFGATQTLTTILSRNNLPLLYKLIE